MGIGPIGAWIAPILSIVGLLVVGMLTLTLMQGEVPFGIGGGNGPGDGPGDGDGGNRTPAPSDVVVVPDEAVFDGSIVYAKAGNVWIQTDDKVVQLTDGGDDAMPTWSPDGRWVYFIHTVDEEGKWPVKGEVRTYALNVPQLMRTPADGTGTPELLATGKFTKGSNTYAFWIRQPVVAPVGTRIAVVSDAPNPDESTVVLQFYDPATEKFSKVDVGVKGVLGHQDPEWRPDGRFLLYVRNGRDGSRGAPVIMRFNLETLKTRELTGPGYLQPAYSPDGKYIAATRTTALGTDVVILDGETGRELLRVTNDDRSWSPTWSPAGDGIAFLHLAGQTVDLHLARLAGSTGTWSVDEIIELTEVSGLDADSGPDWFIPADQLPATPPPTVPPSAAPSAVGSTPPSATP